MHRNRPHVVHVPSILIAACVLAAPFSGKTLAQLAVFPSRTITLVVPFAAGGGTESIAWPLA
jgi:tripartite-type tricarboxylate transporter receptor subunit TctC